MVKKNKKEDKTNKIIALVANIVVPGVGSLIAGKKTKGIIQLVVGVFGWLLVILLGWLIIGLIGIPMMIGVWLWAVIESVQDLME